MNASGPVALQLVQVSKSFGPVVALRSGSLTVHRGSIHALVGENGAGKSTLVKIIAGLYQRDAGDLLLDGEVVEIAAHGHRRDAQLLRDGVEPQGAVAREDLEQARPSLFAEEGRHGRQRSRA